MKQVLINFHGAWLQVDPLTRQELAAVVLACVFILWIGRMTWRRLK